MKYVIVLGDGMADEPIEAAGGKTPLQLADKPVMDEMAKVSEQGIAYTVPSNLPAGSDVANLSMLGYDPQVYYSGRSPLEALSIGVDMKDTDIALRCNVVTVSEDEDYEDKTIIDHSAGEITSEEAAILIEAVRKELEDDEYKFGVDEKETLDKLNLVESSVEKNLQENGKGELVSTKYYSKFVVNVNGMDVELKDVFITAEKDDKGQMSYHFRWIKENENGEKTIEERLTINSDGKILPNSDLAKYLGEELNIEEVMNENDQEKDRLKGVSKKIEPKENEKKMKKQENEKQEENDETQEIAEDYQHQEES